MAVAAPGGPAAPRAVARQPSVGNAPGQYAAFHGSLYVLPQHPSSLVEIRVLLDHRRLLASYAPRFSCGRAPPFFPVRRRGWLGFAKLSEPLELQEFHRAQAVFGFRLQATP